MSHIACKACCVDAPSRQRRRGRATVRGREAWSAIDTSKVAAVTSASLGHARGRSAPPRSAVGMPGDQPRAALEGQVCPEPVECDHEAVAKPDQEVDVHEPPKQPRDPSGQAKPAEIGDGGSATDGGEVAQIKVAERPRRAAAQAARESHRRRICPPAWRQPRCPAEDCPQDRSRAPCPRSQKSRDGQAASDRRRP